MEFSLYAVRRSSLLMFSKPFLLELIRNDPLVVRYLTESTAQGNVRISVIPLNPVTDYDYFITCLHRALHVIQPTNLVEVQHQLTDVGLSD